jgi:hypothetical protein
MSQQVLLVCGVLFGFLMGQLCCLAMLALDATRRRRRR